MNSEIFISYAWGDKNEKGESREAIVNDLYDTLTEKGFNVIRDKVSLGYGGNISSFMQRIGKGKYVIVVISDKYLKSEFCMYEILEIMKNNDYNDRIFPIILSDADIFNELNRLEYLDYWSEKKEELQLRIRNLRELQDANNAHQKLKQYDDIREMIGKFTGFLKDVNALTPDMHADNDFQDMINFILSKESEDQAKLEEKTSIGKKINHAPSPPYEKFVKSKITENQITAASNVEANPSFLSFASSTVNGSSSKKSGLGKLAGIVGALFLIAILGMKMMGGDGVDTSDYDKNSKVVYKTGTVTGTEVNIRNEPYTIGTQILGSVKKNEKVSILEKKNIPAISYARELIRRTKFYYGNKTKSLNRGKAIKFLRESSQPGMSVVEVEIDNSSGSNKTIEGRIKSADLKKLEASVWYKISTPEVEGWIFGKYIQE